MALEQHAFPYRPPRRPVAWDAAPEEWEDRIRYTVSVLVGVGWAFLWMGPGVLGMAPGPFRVVGLVVFAPVLAALARTVRELLGFLATSLGTVLLTGLALNLWWFGAAVINTGLFLFLLLNVAVGWVPTGLLAGLLWGLRLLPRWIRHRRHHRAR